MYHDNIPDTLFKVKLFIFNSEMPALMILICKCCLSLFFKRLTVCGMPKRYAEHVKLIIFILLLEFVVFLKVLCNIYIRSKSTSVPENIQSI